MEVTRIADGLWRWSTYYGEWRDEVGSVYVEADDAVVVVDPLVPEERDEAERFWRALDRDVERAGAPVHVLVTVFWHVRSAAEIVRRYRGRLHASSRARAPIERRAGLRSHVFRPGDPLPAGLEAFPSGRATEVVLWAPAHGALVPGDVLLGDADGGVRFCPESWLPAGVGHAELRAALAPLLELPVERVLVSHGTPVLEDGHAALSRALAA
jgi:glyoxylase-like metal-dependent hydrolase (beta-lactamase superfamily II)